MPNYGLTEDGFLAKNLTTIREELNAAAQAAFGSSIDVGDRSVFGQLFGIMAERYALLWELLEALYSLQDPDKAIGAALEALCLLTGTFRPTATYSVVTLTLTGNPTTLVNSGSQASTVSTDELFQTTANATITALSAWTTSTVYSVGARVTNASRAYECITAGTSNSPAPTGTSDDFADGGGVHWTYLGEGTGAIDVLGRAVEAGEIAAAARDIKTIETQVSGWNSVINLLDATEGRDVATDEELRLLREAELAKAGTSTADALRSDLIGLDDVLAVTIFVNDTDSTNVDGLPPHSVEALVRPVDPPPDDFNQTIFDALFANVAAGIATYGSTTGTATDSQGTAHTVKFSLPTQVQIYAALVLKYDADLYPTDGDQQVKNAIVDFGDAQDTGKNVVPSSLIAQAFKVEGVLEVVAVGVRIASFATPTPWTGSTAYSIGDVVYNAGKMYRCITSGTSGSGDGPTSESLDIVDGTVHWLCISLFITISLRELATFDTSRITIISSATVP